jgi:hypothetical protein
MGSNRLFKHLPPITDSYPKMSASHLWLAPRLVNIPLLSVLRPPPASPPHLDKGPPPTGAPPFVDATHRSSLLTREPSPLGPRGWANSS